MRIYKRKGSPNWWVQWKDRNSKRIRRSSGTGDRSLAQALAAKWVEESFMEQHFGKKPELPFSDALLRYAKTLKRDKPKHFMTKTRYHIKFLAERFDGFNVSDFTYRCLGLYVSGRPGFC